MIVFAIVTSLPAMQERCTKVVQSDLTSSFCTTALPTLSFLPL